MKTVNVVEFVDYLKANYTLIHDAEEDSFNTEPVESNNLSIFCKSCGLNVYGKVTESTSQPLVVEYSSVRFIYSKVQCPKCQRFSISFFIRIDHSRSGEDHFDAVRIVKIFLIHEMPLQLDSYELTDIPPQHSSLRETVKEAMFCMNHDQNMAAALLFRRALQILAKQILGGQGKTLYQQLEWLEKNPNLLKVNLTDLFHDSGDLVREVGNQSAHPEDDPDLQTFSADDVKALHDLFINMIYEVFIQPAKLKQMKDDLISRRKLRP